MQQNSKVIFIIWQKCTLFYVCIVEKSGGSITMLYIEKSLCAIWSRSNYSKKKLFWAKKFLMARNRLTLAVLTQQYTHHLITKYQYYYHSKPYYITAPKYSWLAFLYEIWFKRNSVIYRIKTCSLGPNICACGRNVFNWINKSLFLCEVFLCYICL